MSDKNFLRDFCFEFKVEPIDIEGAKETRERFNAALGKLREMMKPERTPGARVIDSTAIVIDSDVKTLSEPKEGE